ncbi:MAG: hypothetical protein ABR529_07460 [Actinomycetota bacterium]
MEQGPDELSDDADERADDLERLTDKPLDEQEEGSDAERSEDTSAIDPGL